MNLATLPAGCVAECRGCRFRDLSVHEGASRKGQWLARTLGGWSELLGEVRFAAEEEAWGYRQKTCLAAKWDGSRWKLGMRRDEDVIAIPACPVHSERLNRVVRVLSEALPGPERVPLAFVAVSGSLLTLVVKADRAPELPSLDFEALGLTGVFLNLNPSAGNRVFSSRGWKLLWGEAFARDAEGFAYGPDSFRQLIPGLHRAALEEASRFLRPGARTAVLDLCSGTGASLKLWREAGAAAIGVELGGESVACLERNVGPGLCLRGRVSERLPQLEEFVRSAGERELLVFANPPRLGLEPKVLNWLGGMRPARMAYLSCSAGTLSRDLRELERAGLAVKRLSGYDFFPRTHHVETLGLLECSR